MSATQRRASPSRDESPRPQRESRPGRRTRIRRIRNTGRRPRLPFTATLSLGLLASLSTLHMILFRRAKRRLGF